MSGGGLDRGHTMTCEHVQVALSDYVENALSPSARQAVEAHLAACPVCAREAQQLQSLVSILQNRVPHREPVLDIWAELTPKLEQIRHEERLSIPARLKLRAGRFLNNFASGAILFTQALAMNTQARMQKYVISDPFLFGREEA